MSNQTWTTWTDEQLQEHLSQWDALTQEERMKYKITLYQTPGSFPLVKSSYRLMYEDAVIELTYMQAYAVEAWLQEQTQVDSPKPDNTQELRETLGRAAHQAMTRYFDGKQLLSKADRTWEALDEDTRELYRREADGVVEAFRQAQEQVKDALPGAYRIYELRTRMH